MKFELFPFQKTALARLRQSVATALGNYRSTHTPQVVSYTAPTGAGKTIVMSALIEDIYYGDELYPEQPEAIFIWLSDSPQLNEQSRLKIDLKADKIRLNQCVVISDDAFDMEMLEDGHIYFLNTQKLSKSSNLTKHSDDGSTPSGRRSQTPCARRATGCTSSSMKPIAARRAQETLRKTPRSCRSS